MNIQSIGNFYQNNFVQRSNNTTFGQGSLIVAARSHYNPMRNAVDQAAFSTKRKLTDIEICNRILKEEKNRFSPKEISDLNKALGTYNTFSKKAPLLKELLDIKSTHGEKLEADDIIGFLYVTEGSTTKEQDALKTLVKYEIDNYNELNERVFVPLENCPQMLVQLNKINKAFKNLSEDDRGELMSSTFDIIQDSDYEFRSLSLDIAKKLNKDKSPAILYRILYEAAHALSTDRHTDHNYRFNKFKTLLNSFTDKKLEQIKTETDKFYSGSQEQEYIDKYLKEYEII